MCSVGEEDVNSPPPPARAPPPPPPSNAVGLPAGVPTELQPQASTLRLLQETHDAAQPAAHPGADAASGLAEGGMTACGGVMPTAGVARPTFTATEDLLDDSMQLDGAAALPVGDSLGEGNRRWVAAVSHHQSVRLWIILSPTCMQACTHGKQAASVVRLGRGRRAEQAVRALQWLGSA